MIHGWIDRYIDIPLAKIRIKTLKAILSPTQAAQIYSFVRLASPAYKSFCPSGLVIIDNWLVCYFHAEWNSYVTKSVFYRPYIDTWII